MSTVSSVCCGVLSVSGSSGGVSSDSSVSSALSESVTVVPLVSPVTTVFPVYFCVLSCSTILYRYYVLLLSSYIPCMHSLSLPYKLNIV